MARSAMIDAGPSQHPLGVDPSGGVFHHERGASADGGAFSWFIESADQCLDENATALSRGLWPDLADQVGPVNLSIFSRFKPQGPQVEYGPFPMAVGQDRLDFRASGRLFRIRYSGSAAPTACRIGRPIFDVALGGGR